ncbi:MAG: GNAT family N-acetyltransferase [Solobacterium sp.]|nr:GNAT family N-acetyltransferase [Solobacterium sp.]
MNAEQEIRKAKVYTDAHGPASAFVLEFLKRGGRVLEVSPDALVMIQDENSTAFALGDFTDTEILHTTEAVMTDRKDWFDECIKAGGYDEPLIARNAHLLHKAQAVSAPAGITVREAVMDDLDFIDAHYAGFNTDRDYIRSCIERGMLVAEDNGERAGFIGIHEEGSMGLLYILPEHRRRQIAEVLESALIQKLQQEDHFVWCQVEEDNAVSRHLQEKLGLEWGDLYRWLFRTTEGDTMENRLTINTTMDDVELTTDFTMDDIAHVIRRQMEIFKDEFGFTDEENDPVEDLIRDCAVNLKPESEFFLIPKRDGTPIGSVLFLGEGNGKGRLRFVYMETAERGKGIGKRMITEAMKKAKEAGYTHLWLSTYNILTVARNMYASLGFRKTGEAPADWITSQQIIEEIWEADL